MGKILEETPLIPTKSTLLTSQVFFILSATFLYWGYAFYTAQIWEDFFISFRFSQNWVQGNGLVYNSGEKIQGFSSPVVILLLSICMAVSRSFDPDVIIWWVRVINSCLYVCGGILFLRALQARGVSQVFQFIFAILYLFEIKTLAFSANGMETPIFLFFLGLLVFTLASHDEPKLMHVALCFAGLVWTRPDGVVYILCLGISYLCFLNRSAKPVIFFLKAGVVGFLFYLPWLLFSWWYYGTPIPHTVLAKAIQPEFRDLASFLKTWGRPAMMSYLPTYHEFGGWPSWMLYLAGLGAVFPLLFWLVPSRDSFARFASFTFFCLMFYFYFILIYPWYLPAFTLLGSMALCSVTSFSLKEKRVWVQLVFVFCLVMVEIYGFTGSVRQMRIQQVLIEEGTRKQIGLWLKDKVKKREIMLLEPMGYIGYYSGAKIYDYPGLVSPLVVNIRQKTRAGIVGIIPALKPDWVVLRLNDTRLASKVPAIRQEYDLVQVFSIQRELDQTKDVTGMPFLRYDSSFFILKKKAE